MTVSNGAEEQRTMWAKDRDVCSDLKFLRKAILMESPRELGTYGCKAGLSAVCARAYLGRGS